MVVVVVFVFHLESFVPGSPNVTRGDSKSESECKYVS
jgi:hypothetical protein